jgi:signal transduction histidine kinase
MLHEFLKTHREEILLRTRERVSKRAAPRPTDAELDRGIPLFLNQLIETLRTSIMSNGEDIRKSAALHGSNLLRMGFSVAQVVHDYGDICQIVTELAVEQGAPIGADEFQIFNGCLDNAIAEAVTEYARQREGSISAKGTERLAFLAHELRNLINTAMLAFEIVKKGSVGTGGSTSAVLNRSLTSLRDLVDRAFTEARLDSHVKTSAPIPMTEFIEEVEVAASIEASARDLTLTVAPGDAGVIVSADRQLLASAVANLLHNAFKFTHPKGHISLKVSASTAHVLIDVEDECGGLPTKKIEELFLPYQQRSTDRTGLGLGLSISRQAVEANGGELSARDLPGRGCVFTIKLPRLSA